MHWRSWKFGDWEVCVDPRYTMFVEGVVIEKKERSATWTTQILTILVFFLNQERTRLKEGSARPPGGCLASPDVCKLLYRSWHLAELNLVQFRWDMSGFLPLVGELCCCPWLTVPFCGQFSGCTAPSTVVGELDAPLRTPRRPAPLTACPSFLSLNTTGSIQP